MDVSQIMPTGATDEVTATMSSVTDPDQHQTSALVDLEMGQPWKREMSDALITYVAPVLITGGSLGNLLSVVVLQRNSFFRTTTCGFLLSALAVVDTAVLNVLLLRLWIETWTGTDIRSLSTAACKTHIFLTYFLPQLSSWTLVLVTVDRAVVIIFPLRSRGIWTKTRAIITWVSEVIGLAILNAHLLGLFVLHDFGSFTYCAPIAWLTAFFRARWSYVDFIIADVIPFVIILACNVTIIYKMFQSPAKKQKSQKPPDPESKPHQTSKSADQASKPDTGSRPSSVSSKTADSEAKAPVPPRKLTRKEKQFRVTSAMLFVVSIAFLVTVSPRCLYFVHLQFWDDMDYASLDLMSTIVDLIYFMNNAINFVLYCVSGSKFRQAMAKTLCCCCVCCFKRAAPVQEQAPAAKKPIFRPGVFGQIPTATEESASRAAPVLAGIGGPALPEGGGGAGIAPGTSGPARAPAGGGTRSTVAQQSHTATEDIQGSERKPTKAASVSFF